MHFFEYSVSDYSNVRIFNLKLSYTVIMNIYAFYDRYFFCSNISAFFRRITKIKNLFIEFLICASALSFDHQLLAQEKVGFYISIRYFCLLLDCFNRDRNNLNHLKNILTEIFYFQER